jgi:hypothetical protein
MEVKIILDGKKKRKKKEEEEKRHYRHILFLWAQTNSI